MNANNAIAVIGAGSWGCALAMLLAQNHSDVRLWGHNETHLRAMRQTGSNERYLPGIKFPSHLTVTLSIEETFANNVEDILIAVPSHGFRDALEHIKPHLTNKPRIVIATKGIDAYSGKVLHEVAQEILPNAVIAVLSGPSFAKEVAVNMPTAVTVACNDEAFSKKIIERFHCEHFRVYLCDDLTGVEVGGAVKNVLAIAVGVCDGLKFGANTRSALMTRGLAEMMRLGCAMGAKPHTFMGLAGMGDLILTCTDNQSRNRRFGLALGQGQSQQQALDEIGQVVEGIRTTQEIYKLAQKHQVEMPIVEQTYRVLYEKISVKEAVQTLLSRDVAME